MKQSIYLIILLSLLFQTSVKGNIMISTLYAIHLEASPISVGIVVAMVSVFPMVLAVYAGKVSDKFGFRLPLLLGSMVASIALLLPVVFQGLLNILFIVQMLFGLGQIFFQVAMQNLIGVLSDNETRSNNFAFLGLSTATASLIGPLITGFLIEYFSFAVAYLVLMIIALTPSLFMLVRFIKIPKGLKYEPKEHQNTSVTDLLSSRPLQQAFITSGIILTGISLYSFYFPIYGKHIGLTASIIGIILSIHASAFFVVRILMPNLVRKYSEIKILMTSLFISSISFVTIPLFEHVILLAVLSFILGLGLGCGQPLSMVMAYNRSPEGRTGEVLGVRLTVNKIAQFLVPIVFGSLGSILGFIPIFWSNAILLLLGGYFTLDKVGQKREIEHRR